MRLGLDCMGGVGEVHIQLHDCFNSGYHGMRTHVIVG